MKTMRKISVVVLLFYYTTGVPDAFLEQKRSL